MKKVLVFFILLSFLSIWYNIYQSNLGPIIIEKWTDSNNIIFSESSDIVTHFDKNWCNLDFISNINDLWDFSVLLFENTFVFSTKNEDLICIKNQNTRKGLYIINDFWSEFKIEYEVQGDNIKIKPLWNIKYNFIAKEKIYWWKYEFFVRAEELNDINIDTKWILLLSIKDELYSYEVSWDKFDTISETEDSQEFLNCFTGDNYLSSVFEDQSVNNQWIIRESNINTKWTLFEESRFVFNYINNIKSKKSKSHWCFTFKK